MILGDCREVLKQIPDNSVDSIVTDPPYELGFMGKSWDSTGIAYDVGMWRECLRVLKPGGHLLSFGGSRTYHRMACAIEDAGFEVRDQIMWLYGSGFPKSKNLDGDWQGWGTALKPAHEPIAVARKPLDGTVAANVLAYGTGALNIDGCRVALGDEKPYSYPNGRGGEGWHGRETLSRNLAAPVDGNPAGRWPANVLHDGSDEVLDAFPSNESRFFYCAKASKKDRGEGNNHTTVKPTDLMRYLVRLVTPLDGTVLDPFGGSGSTLKAAKLEGFNAIMVEQNPDYLEIAKRRVEAT